MKKIHEDILEWFAGRRDFDVGIELFKQVSRNTFYIANLQRSRKQSTLEYELKKAVKGMEGKAKAPSNSPKGGGKEKTPTADPPPAPTPSVADAPRPPKKGDKAGAQEAGSPKPEARSQKLIIRDEFPFLKRDDCPQELKILVADMLTTHERYVKAHGKLFEVAHKSEDVCFEVADELVDNYLANRQIWDELEHYKKTGKLLGEHPIFEERKRKKEADTLSTEEISKKIYNLNRQLKYRQKLLRNRRKTIDVAKRKEEVRKLKAEIKELEERRAPTNSPKGGGKKVAKDGKN